jgi:D-alanyl-D-alanine carboxypeptidase/D-alanyl-D-alanine-endopeptidase (penicillin-binding protein 4)
MTPKQLKSSIALILLLAIVASSLPFTVAQDRGGNRPRVTNQTPSPTPTPSPSPTPEPVAPTQQQSQRITSNTTSLTELQNRIVEILRKPELSSAMVGIKVSSLDSGRVLFEENANKLLRPASNMKLYTVATALDKLSPEFRFTTSVYAPARPDAAGIVHGDLTIYGRGDPSIAARFNSGDYFKGIEELAGRVAAAGVKRVEGDILGDETYFTGPQYGSGWEWEDLQWWYGAEVSALTVNDNALDLYVKPGAKVGAPAVITTGPPDPLLTIMNHVTTAPSGTKRQLTIYRGLGTHALEVVGTMALDDRGFTGGIGISHPALLFIYLLRSALAKRGVVITGRSRTIGPSVSGAPIGAAPISGLTEIVTFQSPPLSVIAAQTLKPSQNLYTELILRTLGRVVPAPESSANDNPTSESAGLDVVRGFLNEAGINPAALVLSDGSGLSRNDMITAEATLQLLTYMSRHVHANAFRDALPIAGVDGTLRNRMRGTLAENNLRAKTGSLSSAASLSGYLTTASGERLVFSIMVNNYPEDLEPRMICIDPIAVLLASFAGKS